MRHLLFLFAAVCLAQTPRPAGWWTTEPIRWLQTNVREMDATIDPAAFVAEAARMRATVPAHEIALRLWQNIAHGGALAFAINSTFDQQDRQGLDAARPSPDLSKIIDRGIPLLIASDHAPPGLAANVVKRWERAQGYIRVRDQARFPSLRRTSLLMLDGPFTEVAPGPSSPLTFIPPSMFGPPN